MIIFKHQYIAPIPYKTYLDGWADGRTNSWTCKQTEGGYGIKNCKNQRSSL